MSRRRSSEAIEQSNIVTIGELARITGVRYSSLKFYTEEGILPFVQEESGLTRRYDKSDSTKRIEEIKLLRSEGKSIAQIKKMFDND